MTDAPKLIAADLRQFTGTTQWYRHPLNRKMLYTDGAHYLAEMGEAYWLLDEIAIAQLRPEVRRESFQFWKLRVHPGHAATLTCEDGNGKTVFTRRIEYTDFPLEEVKLYCTGNVILLPSEY